MTRQFSLDSIYAIFNWPPMTDDDDDAKRVVETEQMNDVSFSFRNKLNKFSLRW